MQDHCAFLGVRVNDAETENADYTLNRHALDFGRQTERTSHRAMHAPSLCHLSRQ
jgi:hypothetical protein